MAELQPLLQAENIRRSILDYLTTTFALTDAAAARALDTFLRSPTDGLFRGPFIKTHLPFEPAPDGKLALEWDSGLRPYGHQAAAYERLASFRDGHAVRPKPTLVTTGTGSGKTEAFLNPIIDHALRVQGRPGIKALILYPMNALANDQAARLSALLTSRPELADVTAGLFTGQKGDDKRTRVTSEGLITDRYTMCENPPDILLTNYKMLDQLLLRSEFQTLWQHSADSLQYLVLDEFHTYDGAQGTDVAMLIRRLGLSLRAFGGQRADRDTERALGNVTPVATSATLGTGAEEDMLRFASTVFGEEFTADSIVGETRESLASWVGQAPARIRGLGMEPEYLDVHHFARKLEALGGSPDPQKVVTLTLAALYENPPSLDVNGIEDALKAHPVVQDLVRLTQVARPLADLPWELTGAAQFRYGEREAADWRALITGIVTALGYVRARLGRTSVSTEVHFWLRELSRVDRSTGDHTQFYWSDAGPLGNDMEEAPRGTTLPAIYCRRCGRSGWAVELAPESTTFAIDESTVRQSAARQIPRVRYLIYAPDEAAALKGQPSPDLQWLNMMDRSLDAVRPDDRETELDGLIQPVLVNAGPEAEKASIDQTCPACDAPDSVRFIGSKIATLLSVSMSTMFGDAGLDQREKQALVFTDSVQDAAHRAGFMEARSHSLVLRSVIADALHEGSRTLSELPAQIVARAGEDPDSRYRLVPPDAVDLPEFKGYWEGGQASRHRGSVARRLAFDAALEFGLNSKLGRTLELTGAVSVDVDLGSTDSIAHLAEQALAATGWQAELGSDGVEDDAKVWWVRGLVNRIRSQGGIHHRWLDRYISRDGDRYPIWGGRPRKEGMPAFPKGRPAPQFPRVGGTAGKGNLDAVTSALSWYAGWTEKALGVPRAEGGRIAAALLTELVDHGRLRLLKTESGASVYAIDPEDVSLVIPSPEALMQGDVMLECDTCKTITPGSPDMVSGLVGAPCLTLRCPGSLRKRHLADNFYRHMYTTSAMRRVVAREHTSLLDDDTRMNYERQFKNPQAPPDAPNVLVATPTLEMGIDIGDLSAVFLSSLPRSVASYRQRIGRAGRLTGNALAMTYATGRGRDLVRVSDPLSVIEGPVLPPATYVTAEEILRRQYAAALGDLLARTPDAPHPRRAKGAIGTTKPHSYLGRLIALAEEGTLIEEFARLFGPSAADAEAVLRRWVKAADGPRSSPCAIELVEASRRWSHELEQIEFRLQEVDKTIAELEREAELDVDGGSKRLALRTAESTRRMLKGRRAALRSEYWIATLEEFGVFPNYTLFDESTSLGVGVSSRDPDTGQYSAESIEVARPALNALREFAPGATFYARGLEVRIDAVELDDEVEGILQWAFCPSCGYVDELLPNSVATTQCPRCSAGGLGDVGQRVDVVPFRRASAEVQKDESGINDRSDERRRKWFSVATAVDFDPVFRTQAWSVDGVGLGVSYYDQVQIRSANLGEAGFGAERNIAGGSYTSGLFRVCEACGKLDTDPDTNLATEHRAWCRYRTDPEQHVRRIALGHHLRTQGLVLHLPTEVAQADGFAIPSLSAAIQAGLREELGGDPDHLRVIETQVPNPGGQGASSALLLYDQIPGGTGYLTEWARPDMLHRILVSALRTVTACDCVESARQACENCLLPYAGHKVDAVSRASAKNHLETLLKGPVEEAAFEHWSILDTLPDAPESGESVLEYRFRTVLRELLESVGARVEESVGDDSWRWRITMQGAPGGQHWWLVPQEQIAGTRPDFVLRSTDRTVPPVAVYTDGWQYHASASHLRTADDAFKRQDLRDAGYGVLAATLQDVDEAASGNGVGGLISDQISKKALGNSRFPTNGRALRTVGMNPLLWLVEWMKEPDRESLAAAADAVFLQLLGETNGVQEPPEQGLVAVAAVAMGDAASTGSVPSIAYSCTGDLSLVLQVNDDLSLAIVLDDREVPEENSWRRWLRLSNATVFRRSPTLIATAQSLAEEALSEGGEGESVAELDGVWADALGLAYGEEERGIVIEMAKAGTVPVPQIGIETDQGIPLGVSWPERKVAVLFGTMDEADAEDLRADGWFLCLPSVEDIVQTLQRVERE